MIKELRQKLDNKEISAVELTKQYLDRIQKTNEQLNSFITITEEHALERAEHAQRTIDEGSAGLFTGIPYAAKDLFCTKGIRTTAASKILDNYIPPYSATVIERLDDAVMLGKVNLDEFAMGSSNEHSAYGPVPNPIDLTRVAGGSSGGSAASVASGQAVFALATDTCGSTRLPAAFCGVVGFKPTYGRIPRYGVIAMASSLDTVGTITSSVEDAALVLNALAGPDQLDTTAIQEKAEFDYTGGSIKGVRFGIPTEYLNLDGLAPAVKAVFEQRLSDITRAGGQLVEMSLPYTQYALPTYYVLCPAEVSANMARYDGIQFGTPAPTATTLDEVFSMTREAGFRDEVKRRILTGTFVLSAGYYDAYYKKAQQVRTLIIQDFDTAFQNVDVILSPTTSTPAFELGAKTADPLAMYAADMYAAPSSLAGLPTISIPMGSVDALPVGLQIIAPRLGETQLLTIAHAIEQELSLAPFPIAV